MSPVWRGACRLPGWAGLMLEAPGDVALAAGPRQSMHKLLSHNQQGDLQPQAGKRKVKANHQPFWSLDKIPLRGDQGREELGGEGAAGSAGEEDLQGSVILASTLEDLGPRAACRWMLTSGRRPVPAMHSPFSPLLPCLKELEFKEGGFPLLSHWELPPVSPSHCGPLSGARWVTGAVARRREGGGRELRKADVCRLAAAPAFPPQHR